MTIALLEPLTASPLRSLMRLRLSSRIDRALVFLSETGTDKVAYPRRGAEARPYEAPSLAMVARRTFGRACWVSLVDFDATVDIPALAPGGDLRATVRRRVTWRVCDPVIVAQQRLSIEDAPAWIVFDIARRAGQGIGETDGKAQQTGSVTDASTRRATERRVDEVGISYRFHPVAEAPPTTAPAEPDTPPFWGEDQRAAYLFYRDVVGHGPQSLAALWLLHHPEQARDVLDWTVQHQSLLAERTAWERSLAGLLQGLSSADRGFLGVKVAELLSELGISQAEEVLSRIRSTRPPNPPR